MRHLVPALPLVALALAACGAPAARTAPAPAGTTVAAHVTTGDRSRLLARDPDLHFRAAGADTGPDTGPVVRVDEGTRFQTIVGWGAAMTDASAYLIQERMSAAQREALLQELFGRGAGRLGLSFVRVPMGASDFSRTHYSYDDLPAGRTDTALAHFSIAPDTADRIPVLRRAFAINPRLALVGSPWSPPGWMKTTGSLYQGTLRPEFYPAFAEYLRRWIAAYDSAGLPVYAITIQNEPHFEPADYPGMRLDDAPRAAIIRDWVGPLFARRGVTAKILDWDHNWDAPGAPLAVLGDAGARPYVAGVAWHCYAGDVSAERQVHDRYPDRETYFTECSGGDWSPGWADNLKWYVSKMVIGNARGWSRGVALWNLALDEHDGPHLGGCGNCRGVLRIDATSGQVTRNPEYYALAHASRFVRPGAVRIQSTAPDGIETVAFRNADDGSRVLIVLNDASGPQRFTVRDGARAFAYTLARGAVVTFTW